MHWHFDFTKKVCFIKKLGSRKLAELLLKYENKDLKRTCQLSTMSHQTAKDAGQVLILWLSAEPVTRLLCPVASRSTHSLLQGQEYMGVLQQGKHFSSHFMPYPPRAGLCPAAQGTSATK